ncbi:MULTISPECIES: ABC transporter substrate-binding protein [unclassified Microbacterium]|uniref:ABC transporter substrate-binding protein n=1 Tax=unclassified Microbacterium TaxID=2609290 RepID=UPI00214CBD88|nr:MULTISPECIES: ABC transporter substrate-binding protein [unclassified Microbacterium]MCR2783829.1 ABC transporter substrate-binding protein [Microbacterium sp. zg.B96]WIM15322.1 ABC transporter substrate-binding protein [Microbacterium sp. zg-B96]
MSNRTRTRLTIALAGMGVAALALAGCTGDVQDGGAAADCADYEEYGTFDGAEVTIGGTILEVEADALVESWADFEECTGITIDYQGSGEFEAQIAVLAEGGNAPDIGIVPQPGLVARLADGGWLIPASESVEANADEWWDPIWKEYGTVDDVFYAAPLMASIKGYVWYSPAEFEENGWEAPATIDELMTLSEQIAEDTGRQPWCAGFESAEATGWPGTDWVEDYVLRQSGPDVYDQWVAHEIPFNDPQIVEAWDGVGEIIKSDEMVNGGFGDVSTIVATNFRDAGLPILDGECSLHHQATFYSSFWPEGTEVAEDGDVFAFLLPPVDADAGQAVTGAGEFPVAFRDAEEIEAVRTYLSSDLWANNRVSLGGVISANKGLDPENAGSDLLRQGIEILQDPDTTFRFDGSDLMPGAVGADTFWKQMVAWVTGNATTQQAVDAVEASWPTP